jgi:hypothetical protein
VLGRRQGRRGLLQVAAPTVLGWSWQGLQLHLGRRRGWKGHLGTLREGNRECQNGVSCHVYLCWT